MVTRIDLLAAGGEIAGAGEALRILGAAVAVVGFGLLATTSAFARLQRHRVFAALVAGGWPAVAAGWIIGPGALNLISDETVLLLRPLLLPCLGWVGVIVGMQLRRELLRAVPLGLWWWVLLDAVIAGGLGTLLAALVTHQWFEPGANTLAWIITPAALVGAACMGWSPETRSLRVQLTPSTQSIAMLLQGGAGLSGVLAILYSGIVSPFLVYDIERGLTVDGASAARTLVFTVASSVAIGLGGAHLMRLAGHRRGVLLVVFLGVVGLATGLAADLGFFPLLMPLLTGASLATFGRRSLPDYERLLLRGEHVVALLLSLLAGLLLTPAAGVWAWVLVGAILLVRLVVKPAVSLPVLNRITGGATRQSPLRFAPMRQSPMAPVLGVALVLLHDSPMSRAVLTAIVFAGVIADLVPLVIRLVHQRTGRNGDTDGAGSTGRTGGQVATGVTGVTGATGATGGAP